MVHEPESTSTNITTMASFDSHMRAPKGGEGGRFSGTQPALKLTLKRVVPIWSTK